MITKSILLVILLSDRLPFSRRISREVKETALASLEDAGCEIVDLFYTGAAIDLPAWSLKSRLARLPRKMLFALNPDVAVRWLGGFSLMVMVK